MKSNLVHLVTYC